MPKVHATNYSYLGAEEFDALQVRAHWGEKPAYTLADGRQGFKHPADSQKSRVYDWDRALECAFPAELGRMVTLQEAQALCQRVLADYGCTVPVTVRMARADKRGGASAGLREIRFTPSSLRVEIVLHEVAHTVLKQYNLCDSHGPRFAALLRELVYDYAGVSRSADLQVLGIRRKVYRKHTRDWMGYATGVKETAKTLKVRFAAINQIPAPLWRRAADSRIAAGGR